MGMPYDASWWPPKIGDRLREARVNWDRSYPNGRGPGDVEVLLHVVSVFEHAGQTRVVVADQNPAGNWSYNILSGTVAEAGLIWPDGELRPTPWQRPHQ